MNRILASLTMALAILALNQGPAMAASTVVVHPGNLDGWAFQHSTCGAATTTGSQTFVSGPATPPAGSGSLQQTVGPNGDSFETFRNSNYAGTRLSNLTQLRYSTYVTSNNGGQATYLNLLVDWDGNGSIEDQIFFEPVYSGAVLLNTWQTWNALTGTWWALSSGGSSFFPLTTYIAAHPNATIVNSPTGAGGVRLAVGCGGAAWTNFVGYVDAFSIGVSGDVTTFDFELVGPAPSTKDQCKDDGWMTFGTFKNQGECVSSVVSQRP